MIHFFRQYRNRIVQAAVGVGISLALIALPLAAEQTYSSGGWPTLHQDAGNRRAVDVTVSNRHYEAWQSLAGATVLTAPTTSPNGQQIYVTSGQAAGTSNLHGGADRIQQ